MAAHPLISKHGERGGYKFGERPDVDKWRGKKNGCHTQIRRRRQHLGEGRE